ncbi:hypothetical protein GCM10007036_31000 [Alsobacter metallidurans]|uniref:Helix-turn-helix domain-containing protein n=1 Tax=Alsobacter metallidurans TaxID=340221 RepID=A0A917I802_9HYPH|nr:DNA-binding protein [Alsobacter metallidurans]GGH24534.1 hypothetical protein GCM10007036_31000 [Alsobacter metallidurans]
MQFNKDLMARELLQQPPAHNTEQLLSRADAATYVHSRWGAKCSRSFLAKMACLGGGPRFVKIGRSAVYSRPDLDAWCRSRMSAPASKASSEQEAIA